MLKKHYLKVILLLVGITTVLFVWRGEFNFVYDITREDGVIENITAFLYFIGLLFCVFAMIKSKNKFLPILWMLLCFLFLGEETSWFQRFFNYSVEAVESINEQGEFNIHNLKFFQGDELFVDGELNKMTFLDFIQSTQNIFRIAFFGYFIVLPILFNVKKISNLLQKIQYIKPSLAFRGILLIVFGLSFVLAIYSTLDRKMAIAETREMLYALFILIYVIFYIWADKKQNENSLI